MNLDIDTTYKVIMILLAVGVIYFAVTAVRTFGSAMQLNFFRKRQEMIVYGWKLFLVAGLLIGVGFFLFRYGEPIAYHYFPPSPTLTRTVTITITPTITETLINTLTPSITPTLAQTYTPQLPSDAMATIQTPLGPETKSSFSPVQFSTQTGNGWIINTTDTFTLPVNQLYAGFTFEGMTAGLQWTAVWLHEGQVVCFETQVWGNLTGGSGYSDYCNKQITPDMWKPGKWEVQIFIGQTWKTSGTFTLLGVESTPTITPSPGSPNP